MTTRATAILKILIQSYDTIQEKQGYNIQTFTRKKASEHSFKITIIWLSIKVQWATVVKVTSKFYWATMA